MRIRPNRRFFHAAMTLAAAVAIASHASPAHSGPHAGGTLILHREPSITYTLDAADPCDAALLESCEAALTNGRGNEIVVLSIYAAFPAASSPRLTQVRFSLAIEGRLTIHEIGSCADEVVEEPGGLAMHWDEPIHERLVRVAWLAVSNQDDVWGAGVSLLRHNQSVWTFADDAQPVSHDEAAGYGEFGFLQRGTTPCPDGREPLGACCIPPNWQCERLTETQCDALGLFAFFYGPGTDCEGAPCVEKRRPCCLPGDICLYTTRDTCDEKGGFFHDVELLSCVQVSCEIEPQGACCFENGNCSGATEERCAARGGVYQGDLVPCEPAPCPEAGRCCFASDGSCEVLIEEACAEQGGEFTPGEPFCQPNPCPQPASACCLPDRSCEILSAELCAQQSGRFAGGGTECPPVPCAPPGMGACCLSTDVDSCAVVTPEECDKIGIMFQGDGVPCSEAYCGPWPAVEQHSWGRIKMGFR